MTIRTAFREKGNNVRNVIHVSQGFDAATYIVGPEEELPRRLECFTFVMHAPDDYFYYRHAPYPTKSHAPDQEYVLTRLGPKVRLIKQGSPFYQDKISLQPRPVL